MSAAFNTVVPGHLLNVNMLSTVTKAITEPDYDEDAAEGDQVGAVGEMALAENT